MYRKRQLELNEICPIQGVEGSHKIFGVVTRLNQFRIHKRLGTYRKQTNLLKTIGVLRKEAVFLEAHNVAGDGNRSRNEMSPLLVRIEFTELYKVLDTKRGKEAVEAEDSSQTKIKSGEEAGEAEDIF